ncbi:MAG TPA: alpha/beta hydrolase [Ktedonobacteraceae bacterium]|nr:alpha/beta hydrolase [Ktedonobacteraceae bacterium]
MDIVAHMWRHHDIITNGIRMHYVTVGEEEKREKPLLVLLHGFPEFWYSWRYQLPFLSEHGYRVVAPDLRGYNDSDKPRKGYDVATLTRDIEGLIKGLGREQAIIVGHDWGGVLAWAFAMRYPGMTQRLIVMNAPHPAAMERELRTLQQLRKSWYVFAFQLPWLPEYVLLRNHANEIGRMLRGAAVQKEAFPREVTAKFQQAMGKPGAMTAALNYYRQLFRTPSPFFPRPGRSGRDIRRITAPTLLIWGEQDIALGLPLTQGLEQWVDHIQIRRIPDSGHWVQQEKPELVNSFILSFLQS